MAIASSGSDWLRWGRATWGHRVLKLSVLIMGLSILLAAPLRVSNYWVTIFTTIAMLGILAQSWNIITGFVGYPAFGNIAFFGVGAYVVALSTAKYSQEIPYPLTLVMAGVIAGAVCLVLGSPLMRTRGHYFAIGTLGLAAMLQQITYVVPALSTSTAGNVIAPTFPTLFATIERTAYYWMLGTLVLCTASTVLIGRSRFGFGLKAIRADEVAAATYGVPTVSFKISAWVISAFFTGIAGGVWATWIGVINPASAYDLSLAVQYAVIALLGGLGTVSGPLVGAVAVVLVNQTVWVQYPNLHLLVMGVIVMVTVLVLPEGIVGFAHRTARRRPSSDPRSGKTPLMASAWRLRRGG